MIYSDDHYIYYCGQESLRRNEEAIIVNKRICHSISPLPFSFSVCSPWLQILGQILAHLWLKVYIWQPTTETDTSQLKREGNGIYWKAVKLLGE